LKEKGGIIPGGRKGKTRINAQAGAIFAVNCLRGGRKGGRGKIGKGRHRGRGGRPDPAMEKRFSLRSLQSEEKKKKKEKGLK